MNLRRQDGVTLTALIITLAVMAIIAAASLSMIFDKDGLLQSSKESKKLQEEYASREEDKAGNLINDVSSQMEKDYVDSSGANSPKLKEGMIPVKWEDGSWVVTNTKDSNWYNYLDKKWANIMLTDGLKVEGVSDASTASLDEMVGKKVTELGSMFVWIPRYAYKIESNYHNGGEGISGTISVEFLKGITNEPVKSSVNIVEYNDKTTSNYTKFPNGYVVHPGFDYGQSVSGLWVAKFEASPVGATTAMANSQYNGTDKTLQVKPGVSSWRRIYIGNAYTVCLNYNSNLNSHLIKPTEWGAIAYLAQSRYGKSSEIGMNECSNYITGAGPSAENDVYGTYYPYSNISSDAVTLEKYMYTGSQGVKASSTGNVYGVYDLSGGAYEYVAAYLDNSYVKELGTEGAATTNNRYTYSAALINGAGKTKVVYTVSITDDFNDNYETNMDKYGNAIWETSNDSGLTGEGGWYKSYSYFPYKNYPFSILGGRYDDSDYGSNFCVDYATGSVGTSNSFRPVLIVL